MSSRDPVPLIVWVIVSRLVVGLMTVGALEADLPGVGLEVPDCSETEGVLQAIWQWLTGCTWEHMVIITSIALGVIPGAPPLLNTLVGAITNMMLIVWFIRWLRAHS
jgi:hypothetical protein